MAHAIQHRKVSYTLDLDEDEAQTLRDVCDMIGGLPSSRRKYMDSIKQALSSAGIYSTDSEDVDCSSNKIYFTV